MKKYNPKARRLAREFIVQALYQWQLTDQSLWLLKEHISELEDFELCDIPYFTKGMDIILESIKRWDAVLEPYLDRDLNALDPVERAILWLGAYELLEEQDIPSAVVINEAVEVSKLYGAADSHKYINGVLDKLSKQISLKD